MKNVDVVLGTFYGDEGKGDVQVETMQVIL